MGKFKNKKINFFLFDRLLSSKRDDGAAEDLVIVFIGLVKNIIKGF